MLDFRALLQELGKSGNSTGRLPAGQTETRVDARQLRCRMLGNLAAKAGCPFQGRVVNDDQLLIGGKMKVQLDPGNARLERLGKAGQGVFRCFCPCTAVAVNQCHVGSGGLWRMLTHAVDDLVILEVDTEARIVPAGNWWLADRGVALARLAPARSDAVKTGATLRQERVLAAGLLADGNAQGICLGGAGQSQAGA